MFFSVSFSFIAQAVFVIASPPFPVHLTQVGIWLLTEETVSITSFRGIRALYPAQDIVADESAFTSPLTFFPKQGASTRSAHGSQTNPIIF